MKWYVTMSNSVVVIVESDNETDAMQLAGEQYPGFGTPTKAEVI